jgi:membrane protease YdiL (CAAX protease family)
MHAAKDPPQSHQLPHEVHHVSPSHSRFFLIGTLFELGLGGVAFVLGALTGHAPLATLRETAQSPQGLLLATGTGLLATLPLIAGLLLLERCPWQPIARLKELVQTQLVPLFRSLSTWQLGLLSLAAGWGEEMLFRGWLQTAIVNWLPGPSGIVVAVAAASLLFGICHWLTPAYGVLAMLISAYLGVIFIASNSLLTPVVAHAAYDFFALVYLTSQPVESHPADSFMENAPDQPERN